MSIREAVTVALVHGDQLLLTQRSPRLRAFPGYHAFPGGKVDAGDHTLEPTSPLFAGHPPHLLRALTRELKEEVGIDLFQSAEDGAVQSLHCLGEATTPEFSPVRFRTWFYKVTLDPQTPLPVVVHEPGELAGCEWRSAKSWWASYNDGDLLVAPPTRTVLETLAHDISTTGLESLNLDFDPSIEIPWVEPVAGVRILLVRSNTLPPAVHTNVFWFGDEGHPRVLVDPSPANRGELERLCARVSEWGVDIVFLTHHHPDHREFADEMARRFGVPIGVSEDSEKRIRARGGETFFSGIEVKTFSEGDVLTHWRGEPVRLLAVPGHDEGQLAPMPDSRRWCIVGDLIQGVGTVVIAPPEGNMRKYFFSLQRVLDLDPAVVIPSHGLALGTTHYLRAALDHRIERERVIGGLHHEGRTEDEILGAVYRDIDPRLLPLARLNIRSHLDKLREDAALA